MSWRLALSLSTLRSECNALWPDRSKASDGTIGDTSHAATASDHNPNAAGVVCAFDLTHDPDGPDGSDIAEKLRARPHPDVKYVIWSHRMFSRYPAHGYDPFQWRPYTGADPHTNHVHVSVGVGPDGRSVQPYDDLDSWFHVVAPPAPPPEDPMAPIVARPDQALFILHQPGHPQDGWIVLGAHGDTRATHVPNPDMAAFWQQYVPGPLPLDVQFWEMLTITEPGYKP